jgi:hypothetical protein
LVVAIKPTISDQKRSECYELEVKMPDSEIRLTEQSPEISAETMRLAVSSVTGLTASAESMLFSVRFML